MFPVHPVQHVARTSGLLLVLASVHLHCRVAERQLTIHAA